MPCSLTRPKNNSMAVILRAGNVLRQIPNFFPVSVTSLEIKSWQIEYDLLDLAPPTLIMTLALESLFLAKMLVYFTIFFIVSCLGMVYPNMLYDVGNAKAPNIPRSNPILLLAAKSAWAKAILACPLSRL